MRKLQRLCVAAVFTLALTTATFAGEIHTPGIAGEISTPGIAQPPPPVTASSSAMAQNGIPIDERSSTPEGDSFENISFTDVALSLLQTMLSVF